MVQNNTDKIGCNNVINLKNYDDGTHYSIEEMNEIYTILIHVSVKINNKEHIKNIEMTQKE